MHILQYQTG